MTVVLVPTLYVLSGVCAYAALHHALIAWRWRTDRTNFVFALFCIAAGLFIAAGANAYQAVSADALVEMRRDQFSLGMLILALFPWIVVYYLGSGARRIPAAFSAFFLGMLVVNVALRYGVFFAEYPELNHLVLPWGERVADLRVQSLNAWHNLTWIGVAALFTYSIRACVHQYRSGARRRALTLALGVGLFVAFGTFVLIVDLHLVQFVHTADLGFVSLVGVMSLGITLEMQEHEQRMQAVLDNVPAAVYMKSLDGRYLMVNRLFEEWSGFDSAAVMGKKASDLVSADQTAEFIAHDQEVIRSRQPMEFEESLIRDGQVRNFASLKFPLLDRDGIPYAVCGVSTDVTLVRSSEREMDTLRRQVWHADRVARTGALSASIAHELNQPLTAILSNAQAALRFLDRDDPNLTELREILTDIVYDDKRAGTVITSLRSMLRQRETERSDVDIAETLNEMLGLLRSELIEQQVQVTTDFAADCVAPGDKGQIQQVLLNLVLNAMEAMSEQPDLDRRLKLAAAPDGDDAIRISVRDSGTGIPPEQIGKVFDPFYSTKALGMGIGLAVSRAIVEAHGGSIWVEPAEDRGVIFAFTLPRKKAGVTDSDERSPSPAVAR